MLRDRTFLNKKIASVFHQERFFPAGNYTWVVPAGCESVDVFLVGGGGGANRMGAGAGYTMAYRGEGYTGSSDSWQTDQYGGRNGNAITVVPGESCSIVVGAGGAGSVGAHVIGNNGGVSSFQSISGKKIANGGIYGTATQDPIETSKAGDGGSGGGAGQGTGGSDGSDGTVGDLYYESYRNFGYGQGHTTRDFGELSGKRNAGGGGGQSREAQCYGGASDYTNGSGESPVSTAGGYAGTGGGGYGGGGGSGRGSLGTGGAGGDGTVLIRYYAYA